MKHHTSQNTSAAPRKFGIRDCLSYAAGDFGCNMSFALKGTVNTFWLVYMNLNSTLFAVLLLLVQIWDALNDPIIGSIIDADHREYKKGKFKTYILIGSIGLLVAGSLCFIPIPGASTLVKSALFLVGYVIWDAFYTVANVPYGSMLSLITEKTGERAQLSTWRSVGSVFGNMLPIAILPFLIWKKETNADGTPLLDPDTGKQIQTLLGERVFWVALVMGVLGFLAFQFMLKNSVLRVSENRPKKKEGKGFPAYGAFGNFLKNRAAVGATLAAMATFLGFNSASTATQIMFALYFEQPQLSGLVSIVGFLPAFLFMPFIKKIAEHWGKKEASFGGSLVALGGASLMLLFPLFDKNTGLLIYILSLSIFGLGMGIYTCVSWSLMADAIDYNQWKTGRREEGTVYSLHSFFRKLAQGFGPSLVILIMGLLGYRSEVSINAQTLQTAQNMCWLVAGLFFFSAVLTVLALGTVYPLNKKELAVIHRELQARKETE